MATEKGENGKRMNKTVSLSLPSSATTTYTQQATHIYLQMAQGAFYSPLKELFHRVALDMLTQTEREGEI